MNIEHLKELMTPVVERLPEKKENIYWCLFTEDDGSTGQCLGNLLDIITPMNNITHYLDPSTLTTKKRALELAEKSFDAGMEREYQGHFGGKPNTALSLGEFKEKFKTLL